MADRKCLVVAKKLKKAKVTVVAKEETIETLSQRRTGLPPAAKLMRPKIGEEATDAIEEIAVIGIEIVATVIAIKKEAVVEVAAEAVEAEAAAEPVALTMVIITN